MPYIVLHYFLCNTTTMKRILLIEDEVKIVRLVRDYLEGEGYKVLDARDGEEGLVEFEKQEPELIILDLMLPKKDGLTVAREVRKQSSVPIIMLTAKSEEADRVAGLELGADDYITKPFSLRELVARIKAVLRRSSGELDGREVINRGELLINPETHQVKLAGREINPTPTEFDLLYTMAKNPGRAFSRRKLLDNIDHSAGKTVRRKIDNHVKNLRKKLGGEKKGKQFIETVHGVGYRFRAED